MSMLYLLRHYSKENLELYKAQSAGSGKQSGEGRKPQRDKGAGGKGKNEPAFKKEKKQQPPADFYVPGRSKDVDGRYPPVRSGDSGGRAPAPVPSGVPAPARPQENPNKRPGPQQPERNVYPLGSGKQSAGFGDTVIVDEEDGGGTILIHDVPEKATEFIRPHLIRQSNRERIMIDKQVFRIGRERNYVDYCVSDNNTVGRSHANIISRDGAFYIVDINSRNHTYVNGEQIESNTEVRLEHGTMISLSNESFEFRLY